MGKVSMKALLESGVHFGHRTHRWNPNMREYIFTERNGIHIIDLQLTVKYLDEASKVVIDTVAKGGTVLFVGTKRQAVETIEEEAKRCGMPYVTVRWLGGMLTNWKTMRERINELERLERMRDRGDFERLTKKEGLMLTRKIDKLEARFGGIRKMHGLPDMAFIIDVRREDTAVKEANTLNIPIVGLVDTNADPRIIDHVVPSNDDAIRAIKLLVGHIADAVIEGRAMRDEDDLDMEQPIMAEEERETIDEMSDEELLGKATLKKMAETEAADALAAAEDAARVIAVAEAKAAEKDAEEEETKEADAAEDDAVDEEAKEADAAEDDAVDEEAKEADAAEDDAVDEEAKEADAAEDDVDDEKADDSDSPEEDNAKEAK